MVKTVGRSCTMLAILPASIAIGNRRGQPHDHHSRRQGTQMSAAGTAGAQGHEGGGAGRVAAGSGHGSRGREGLRPFLRGHRLRPPGVQARGRRLHLPHPEGGVIRPAQAGDVEGIAAIHAATWQAAYAGILPASTLQSFTIAKRRTFWAGVGLGDAVPDRPIFVALEDDVIVGFAVCGPPRDPEVPFDAELYVLNVAPGRCRCGIGHSLFARCIDHLSERGRASFYLWVLAANERARRFYESLKGRPLASYARDAHFDGVAVPEIAYGWAELPIASIGGR